MFKETSLPSAPTPSTVHPGRREVRLQSNNDFAGDPLTPGMTSTPATQTTAYQHPTIPIDDGQNGYK